MRHFLLALVFVVGCVARTSAPVAPPASDISPVTAAAAQSMDAFRSGLADEAETTATKAGDYADWQAAYDDWQSRNKAVRERAFVPYTDALNTALPGDRPYDATKLATEARHAAQGFRKGGRP